MDSTTRAIYAVPADVSYNFRRLDMRILDEMTNKSTNNLTVLLEKNEAIQLIGYLEELVTNDSIAEHYHLNNADYSKEITIALYDVNRLDGFSERYKTLIIDDE